MAPEWLPFAYTAQSAFYLPTRILSYKRKAYHYFLFGELVLLQFRFLVDIAALAFISQSQYKKSCRVKCAEELQLVLLCQHP